MASSQSLRIFSFKGHAGVVKTTVNRTSPTPNSTSLIIPKVTKSFFKSGSWTVLKAPIISSLLTLNSPMFDFNIQTSNIQVFTVYFEPNDAFNDKISAANFSANFE